MPLVTLAQLQSRVYTRLDQNTLLYTQQNITDSLNEAIRVVNAATGFQQGTIQVPGLSQANRVWYDVPQGILIPIRCQFESGYLNKYFPNQIGKAYATWLTDTTDNSGLPVSCWVPCGFSKFAIHPADSIGGSPIFISGVLEPTQLVNPTDAVNMPVEYTDILVNLSAQTLCLKETGALFKQSSLFYQTYLSQIKKFLLWRSAIMPRYYVPELVQKQ